MEDVTRKAKAKFVAFSPQAKYTDREWPLVGEF
jgi:hypothetical protein